MHATVIPLCEPEVLVKIFALNGLMLVILSEIMRLRVSALKEGGATQGSYMQKQMIKGRVVRSVKPKTLFLL